MRTDLNILNLLTQDDWQRYQSAHLLDSLDTLKIYRKWKFQLVSDFEKSQLGVIAKDRRLVVHEDFFKVNWPLDSNSLLPSNKEFPNSKTRLERLYLWQDNHQKSDSIAYLYAQVLQDEKKWDQALFVLQKILKNHPNSAMAYRAAFLKGYIFYEYTREDQKATRAFEEMLAKYPKNELSDDAEVLLKDLKSDRKHLKKLMNSLGQDKK